jgi:hypothetical protein
MSRPARSTSAIALRKQELGMKYAIIADIHANLEALQRHPKQGATKEETVML